MEKYTSRIKKLAGPLVSFIIISTLLFSPSATHSQTTEQLQALLNSLLVRIAELQSQIAAQGGGSSGNLSSFRFTRNLNVGSNGADVTALQKFLIAKGFLRPISKYGHFGAVTQAALAAYQRSQRITPVAGFFGPTTRSRVNSQISTTVFASTGSTGILPPGCVPGSLYSRTTGAPCDPSAGGVGGIGSIITNRPSGGGGGPTRSRTTTNSTTSAECQDGLDNDSDGLTDYPVDPECIDGSQENGSSVPRKTLYAFRHIYVAGGEPVYQRDYHNIISPWILSAGEPTSANPALAKAYLDRFEPGARAMFSWSFGGMTGSETGFFSDADNCTDTNGGTPTYVDQYGVTKPYRCPWMDTWLSTIRVRWDNFFREYAAIGGKIDFLTMDNEFMNDVSGIDQTKFDLILSNPKYSQANTNFRSTELAYGPMQQKMGTLDTLIRNPTACAAVNCQTYVGLLLADWFRSYTNKAMAEPLLSYFPNVDITNFNDYYYNYDTFYAPLDTAVTTHISGGYNSDGSIFGTHQNRGTLYTMEVFSGGTVPIDGIHLYNQTYFNKIKQEVNWAKVSALSKPDAPLAPLFAGSSHIERDVNLAPPAGTYAETVFHMALAGAEYLQLWTGSETTTQEKQDLSYALDEFDTVAGFEDKHSLASQDSHLNSRLRVTDKSAWNDDYILTGMTSAGRKIWRFTPDGTQMDVQGTLVSESPVTFLTPQVRITFPEGVIYHPSGDSESSLGFWIVQPEDAGAPAFSDSSINSSPVASFTVHQLDRVNNVLFISYGSYDPDGTTITIEYDFNGDGVYGDPSTYTTDGVSTYQLAVSSLQDQAWVSNFFTTGGTHTVGIKVTDAEGATATYRKTFTLPGQACIHTVFTGLCEVELSALPDGRSSNLAVVMSTLTNDISSFLSFVGESIREFFYSIIGWFV